MPLYLLVLGEDKTDELGTLLKDQGLHDNLLMRIKVVLLNLKVHILLLVLILYLMLDQT